MPSKGMKQMTKLRTKAKRTNAKEALTIHEIAPIWSRLIPIIPKTEQQEFYKNGKQLDISEAKLCIVGEAHGFNRDYFESDSKDFCRDCFAHSVEFGAILLDPPSKREPQVQAFVNHWNTCHI